MRIVIDLQGAQSASRLRGIGRYSLALAQAMVRNGPQHEFIVVLSDLFPETIEPIRALFDRLLDQRNIRVWSAAGPVHGMDDANNWRRHTAELLREAFLNSLAPDVVHITSMFEGFYDNAVHSVGLLPSKHAIAVTFYDVIPLIQSEVYLKPHPTLEMLYLEKIRHLRKVDIFLAISESSRQEAVKYLNVAPHRVVDIAAAVDDSFCPLEIPQSAEAALRHRFGLSKPFVMYSGATDERKNHLRLIRAYSLLPSSLRAAHQLAIVGRIPGAHHQAFMEQARACGLDGEDVVITGGVSDLEMQQLYNLCHLFVFPSWHEGFGLPALEAMACGAAVIGSNTTSLPEVIGREDALFDPFDEKDITAKMLDVLQDNEFRMELKRHALIQASKFSWDRSAKTALGMFESSVTSSSNAAVVEVARPTLADGPPNELVSAITDLRAAVRVQELDWITTARSIAQNHPRTRLRQIFVDVSELAVRDARSGIQRVVRSVLRQLLDHPPAGYEIQPVRATPLVPGYFYARRFSSKFQEQLERGGDDDAIEAQNGDIFLGLDLQHNVVIPQAGFLKSLRDLGVRVYFVVYDLLPIILPHRFPKDLHRIHSMWLDVLDQHDGVICISRTVADEFRMWLDAYGMKRLRPLNVGWFHLGADFDGTPTTRGFDSNAPEIRAAIAARPSFLCVGTIEPRKGHHQILQAFDYLWKTGENVNLVLVGREGWHVERLVRELRGHRESGRRLFWLETASDEYLEAIYKESDCLIAGSEGEGFGLPLIEASLQGIPIIARDIPVFREVAGDSALYFKGNDPLSLAKCVREWLAMDASNSVRSSLGISYSTWEQSTKDLVDVFVSQRWYYQWESPEGERIWASSGRFGTLVGTRQLQEMLSTKGQAGCLLHGPYLSLDAGQYTVVIRGRLLESTASGARMDVAMNKGAEVLCNLPLTAPEDHLSAILASAVIDVPEKCSDLEVRVWVDGTAEIALSLIEIAPFKQLPAS